MALYKLLCALTVGILLTPDGCLSDEPVTSPDCGQANRSVEPADMPWSATLTNEAVDEDCAGVLVGELSLLLTGPCQIVSQNSNSSDTWAHVGSQGNQVTVGVEKVIMDDGTLVLVKLNQPVNFTKSVSPICLPAEGNKYSSNFDVYVVHGMNKSKSEIIGPKQCKCELGDVDEGMICAEEEVKGVDCKDLQVSALYGYAKGSWVLVGTGRYDPHCPYGSGVVTYMDLSQHQDYLANITGLMNGDFLEYVAENDTDKYFVCNRTTTTRPMMSTTDDKPPMTPDCPHPTTTTLPPPKPPCGHKPCCDPCGDNRDSIFDDGVSLMHGSPFVLLCLSVLSLYY